MILKVTDIGELVLKQRSRAREGTVRRVFHSSAYVETSEGLILLLHGGLRSPMTVNLDPGENPEGVLSAGDAFHFRGATIKVGELSLVLEGAKVFRSSLRRRAPFRPIAAKELVRGAVMLRLLYNVSSPALDLVGDRSFKKFVRSVLLPVAGGRLSGAYLPDNYFALIGLGSGFTPAGDDFVSGFTAAFNYVARRTGAKLIALPMSELLRRTVPESATILGYAQNGYVDEDLEKLILSAAGARQGKFTDQLLEVARRGHTSGIDMSSGVVLSVAAVRDGIEHDGALESVLLALTGSRTL
ncbi:MAG: DUF2877 domain-containing protein [Nitrososphaerales archaeon]|nr:DUF2877 domain-containing protein [Nitrososphaerales archaeon]